MFALIARVACSTLRPVRYFPSEPTFESRASSKRIQAPQDTGDNIDGAAGPVAGPDELRRSPARWRGRRSNPVDVLRATPAVVAS